MPLDLARLTQMLPTGATLEYHEAIASTNDRALELARAGAAHGTLVCADYQSAGRGRRGAAWVAPPGACAMGSVILRPPAPWPVYYWTVMAGLAAALAAREFGVDARIKWPNDVMIGDRKLAGVLVEMAGDAAVVGVGINCTLTEADLPLELHGRTASLHQHIEGPPDREAVLAALRLNLMALHQTLAEGSVNPMVIGWNAHNWLRRRPVRVTGPTGIVEGEGLFLNGVRWTLDVFRDGGVVAMPLSSSVAAR